nr:AMP-dependent synthetase/ligase [Agromyces seonyuensis]
MLEGRLAASPDRELFALPTESGGWTPVTVREFHSQVIALAKGFVAAGVEPGQKIGMMSRTRYEWTLVDFAVWYAGAFLVPIYETSSPAQVAWILGDSGATSVIVETADHFARFDEVHPELPQVSTVWQIGLGDLDKLVAAGVDVPDAEIERRRDLASGSDVATLIYTSGSTGRPKGTIITHSNFVELSRNTAIALEDVVLDPRGASTLLFITTAHVFARLIAVLCVHAGVRVGHQPDTRNLMPAMQSFRPTFLLAVPRVFEKVYNVSEQKAETGGKGKIFRAAAAVAVEYSSALEAGSVPLGLRLKFAVYDRLVFAKLRAALGGRVKFAVSGSAPLGVRLGHFYHALGIHILEGYGLTETTAPASVNLPKHSKIGTVGPALPGVGFRIAEDGEIEIQGLNVSPGYWNNPTATADSFVDGWFKTGDLGTLDADGYLTITGRKKEIIVTAGGKNVAPAALEDRINSSPVIAQSVVVGDQQPFIAALVTLDREMLPTWLANNGLDPKLTLEEARANPTVRAEVQRAVDAANDSVSRAESVRKFTILPVEFTEDSGHLTPKLSIKRNVILSDFAEDIAALYSGAPVTEGTSALA